MRKPLHEFAWDAPAHVGLSFEGEKDIVRAEFLEETRTEAVLRRFGLGGFAKPAQYGVQDFESDLQQIQNAVIRAVDGVKTLPEAVRSRYATKEALLVGLARGELILAEDGLSVAAAEVPQSGASGAATSQSEAAGGSSVT